MPQVRGFSQLLNIDFVLNIEVCCKIDKTSCAIVSHPICPSSELLFSIFFYFIPVELNYYYFDDMKKKPNDVKSAEIIAAWAPDSNSNRSNIEHEQMEMLWKTVLFCFVSSAFNSPAFMCRCSLVLNFWRERERRKNNNNNSSTCIPEIPRFFYLIRAITLDV